MILYVCLFKLEKLLKEADVGEDWTVDPALKEACESVARVHCKDVKGGEGRSVWPDTILFFNVHMMNEFITIDESEVATKNETFIMILKHYFLSRILCIFTA